ncbi:MAG: AAA family ATPase [Bacteroidetes bacterium]|nr:AAA family ATPase [Bacteroidota bacterium]
MYLKNVTVNKFKSFQTLQNVHIEKDITTLVGMNESGKTSFLNSLAKINYFTDDKDFIFDITSDYPRKELVKFQKSEDDVEVVNCTFELDSVLIKNIELDLGKDVILFKEFNYSYKYKSKKSYFTGVKVDQKKYIENLLSKYEINPELKELALNQNNIEGLLSLDEKNEDENYKNVKKEIQRIKAEGYENWDNKLESYVGKKWLKANMPKFWYYDDYYSLAGRINLNELKSNQLSSEKTKTAKALFELADISIDDIINSNNYERFIALLEASSNEITDQIFKYWSTNKNLDIEFKIDTLTKPNPQNPNQIYNEKVLDIRVRSQIHKITLPLDKRSKGFNWFFAFIIWFSKIQADKSSKYILLFDEPGLNLHASAQADLLKFLEDLSENYQIIFTTHSPFMIDSEHLERVRTVVETEDGSIISDSLQEKDPNTLFPLQAALGYDIAQNLFISKNDLLVEGPADLLYLIFFSNLLEMHSRVGLKDNITIVPVGGLDKVSTFISLLRGSKLNVVCLLDSFSDQKGKQKVDDLIKDKIIKEKNIRFFDEFIPALSKADIEDLFVASDYLKLFNETFNNEFKSIQSSELDSKKSIIPQINKLIGKERFNHYRVAYRLTQLGISKDYFDETTLKNFENVFKEINKLF